MAALAVAASLGPVRARKLTLPGTRAVTTVTAADCSMTQKTSAWARAADEGPRLYGEAPDSDPVGGGEIFTWTVSVAHRKWCWLWEWWPSNRAGGAEVSYPPVGAVPSNGGEWRTGQGQPALFRVQLLVLIHDECGCLPVLVATIVLQERGAVLSQLVGDTRLGRVATVVNMSMISRITSWRPSRSIGLVT